MSRIIHGAWLAVAVLLAGCATPKYQFVNRLVPPEGPAAQQCLAQCDAASAGCTARCRSRHEACVQAIEPEVERRYAEALDRYGVALERYRLDLERYRLELWLSWGHNRLWRDPWPADLILAPAPVPLPPRRERIRESVIDKKCDTDCGCRSAYENCVVGCGGHKVEEKRCVANCPSP